MIFSLLHPFSDYYFIPIIFWFAYEGENQGKLINIGRSENIKRQHLFKCKGNDRFTYQKCFLKILTMHRFNFIGSYSFCTFRPIHILKTLCWIKWVKLIQFLAKFTPVWLPETSQSNDKQKSFSDYVLFPLVAHLKLGTGPATPQKSFRPTFINNTVAFCV